MGLAARSLYLVAQHVSLTDTESQAIAYHDGQYIDDNRIVAHREEPLTLLLRWADYWTAHICEEGRISAVEGTKRCTRPLFHDLTGRCRVAYWQVSFPDRKTRFRKPPTWKG